MAELVILLEERDWQGSVTVKKNATIDWTQKESVRAGMRVAVKRVLRKYGYSPDKQERAIALVIEQAEQLGLEFGS